MLNDDEQLKDDMKLIKNVATWFTELLVLIVMLPFLLIIGVLDAILFRLTGRHI